MQEVVISKAGDLFFFIRKEIERMLVKTITYTDYNGTERTEKHYFNLNESEIFEMEMGTANGLVEQLQDIIAAKDGKKIMEMFKNIILTAYGEKTPDGRRLMKSEEISKAFSETEAYNKLFIELVTDANAASAFVNAIIPQRAEEQRFHAVPAPDAQ